MPVLTRAAAPIVLLGAGLLLLSELLDGAVSDTSTLIGRAAGGAALTLAVVLLVRPTGREPDVDDRCGGASGVVRVACGNFAAGACLWLVPAACMFALLWMLGAPMALAAGASDVLRVGLLVLAAVLLSEALPEELVFRGHLLGMLLARDKAWRAITVQAAVFTGFAFVLRGFPGLQDLSLFAAMGGVLGYLRWRTGSVWTPVGFHAAFQTVSQLVLTHDVVDFAGSTDLAMVALGAVPFSVAVVLVDVLPSRREGHPDVDRTSAPG